MTWLCRLIGHLDTLDRRALAVTCDRCGRVSGGLRHETDTDLQTQPIVRWAEADGRQELRRARPQQVKRGKAA